MLTYTPGMEVNVIKKIQRLVTFAIVVSLLWLLVAAITGVVRDSMNPNDVFHLAFWVPPIGLALIISGQLDLLTAIAQGKTVNIKARCIDFLHWLLLIFIDIGAWIVG